MEIIPVRLLALAAANDELIFFRQNLEIALREACDGQRDAQALGLALRAGQTLDIVGRLAIVGGLRNPVERLLDLVEAEQERVPGGRGSGHRGRHPESEASALRDLPRPGVR